MSSDRIPSGVIALLAASESEKNTIANLSSIVMAEPGQAEISMEELALDSEPSEQHRSLPAQPRQVGQLLTCSSLISEEMTILVVSCYEISRLLEVCQQFLLLL